MTKLMGFKRGDIPNPKHGGPSNKSIYDDLIDEVCKTKACFINDVGDVKRALSLSSTIASRIRKRKIDNVKAGLRGTVVYVMHVKGAEQS